MTQIHPMTVLNRFHRGSALDHLSTIQSRKNKNLQLKMEVPSETLESLIDKCSSPIWCTPTGFARKIKKRDWRQNYLPYLITTTQPTGKSVNMFLKVPQDASCKQHYRPNCISKSCLLGWLTHFCKSSQPPKGKRSCYRHRNCRQVYWDVRRRNLLRLETCAWACFRESSLELELKVLSNTLGVHLQIHRFHY